MVLWVAVSDRGSMLALHLAVAVNLSQLANPADKLMTSGIVNGRTPRNGFHGIGFG